MSCSPTSISRSPNAFIDSTRITAPATIVGARTTAQLNGILQAEDVTLPPEISSALDDVSARPLAYPA